MRLSASRFTAGVSIIKNRYTEDAVDLCDILSSFAPHSKASLNELSKITPDVPRPRAHHGRNCGRPRCATSRRSGRVLEWQGAIALCELPLGTEGNHRKARL